MHAACNIIGGSYFFSALSFYWRTVRAGDLDPPRQTLLSIFGTVDTRIQDSSLGKRPVYDNNTKHNSSKYHDVVVIQ
eukprot:scaffold151132_cov31-Attheya_sp.AAC.1